MLGSAPLHDRLISAYAHLDPHEVLAAPPEALLGVSPAAQQVLQELQIASIYDLAASQLFGTAHDLALGGGERLSHRYGRAAADAIDRSHELSDLGTFAEADVEVLAGVGPNNVRRIKEAFSVTTIRDLALWPPYVAARDIALRLLLPDQTGAAASGTPEDLLPRSGEYPTERVYYQSLVLGEELTPPHAASSPEAPKEISMAGVLDPIAAVDKGTGYTRPAVGALLIFSQSWYPQGVALGQLLHSVALAPGESTRIAMIDWSRQSSAQQASTDEQAETLSNTLGHNRSISEVVLTVAGEARRGESESNVDTTTHTAGASVSGQGPAVSASATYGMTTTAGRTWGHTSSEGQRSIAADMTQQVADRTHQAANAARNRRASVVREVSQSESEVVSTRLVANYNHMHAMSVQYYEVVQAYRVVTRLDRADRCLFVPMKLVDFADPRVLKRFRHVLAASALDAAIERDLKAGNDTLIVKGPGERAGQGWTDDTVARAERDLGRPVRLSADSVALPAGTVFWIGSATKDVRIVQVEGLRHVGDRKLLRYEGTQYGGGYSGDWPAQQLPDMPQGFPTADLSQFRALRVRLEPREGPWGTAGNCELSCNLWAPIAGSRTHATLYYRTTRPAGGAAVVEIDLAGGLLARGQLLEHLEANRFHYSQAVWQSLDGAVLASMLHGLTMGGKPLTRLVDSKPVGTTGNYLVFRLHGTDADPSWREWKDDHGVRVGHRETSVVPLPSGGVFAEAVLGRSNSAEKLDFTRFWDWQASPLPLSAPDIAPVATGSRQSDERLEHLSALPPMVNIVGPAAAPDPLGLTAALSAISKGDMFKDMSGGPQLAALAGQALVATAASAAGAATSAPRRNPTEIGGLANLGRDMDKRATEANEERTTQGKASKTNDSKGSTQPTASPPDTTSMERTLVHDSAVEGHAALRWLGQTVLAAAPSAGPRDTPALARALVAVPKSFSPKSVTLATDIRERFDTGDKLQWAALMGVLASLVTSTPAETLATRGYDLTEVAIALTRVSPIIISRIRTLIEVSGVLTRPQDWAPEEQKYWKRVYDRLRLSTPEVHRT